MKLKLFIIVTVAPFIAWTIITIASRLSRMSQLHHEEKIVEQIIKLESDLVYQVKPSQKQIKSALNHLIQAELSTNTTSISESQAALLENKLLSCITSHLGIDTESYIRLLTPATDIYPKWAEDGFMQFVRQTTQDLISLSIIPAKIQVLLKGNRIEDIQDPREMLRLRRRVMQVSGNTWTNSIYCDRCWSAYAAESMTLRIEATPYPPNTPAENAKITGRKSMVNQKITQLIKPTLLETLKANGIILTVAFSFVVKNELSNETSRIFTTFYFSPENNDWILEGFANSDVQSALYYDLF